MPPWISNAATLAVLSLGRVEGKALVRSREACALMKAFMCGTASADDVMALMVLGN